MSWFQLLRKHTPAVARQKNLEHRGSDRYIEGERGGRKYRAGEDTCYISSQLPTLNGLRASHASSWTDTTWSLRAARSLRPQTASGRTSGSREIGLSRLVSG